MENEKSKPVRITYKIVKKQESPLKPEETRENQLGVGGINVSHKQKHVLVAFLEEQGKAGAGLMYRAGKDGEGDTDRETIETVGGGLWREVAVMLNSARVGGCVMSPQEWKKYWLDLMESTEKLIDRLKEKNPRFKLESLPQLHKRIYKLATGHSHIGSNNATSDVNNLSWDNEEDMDESTPGGSLMKELADQMNCKDIKECKSQIDKATRTQGNFDAVYLKEGADSDMENERSAEEDDDVPLQRSKGRGVNARKRKRPSGQHEREMDAVCDKDVMVHHSRYQSAMNFLRLKQERLKVCLLEREIELRNTECEHRKQIHESEMKRREMEMIHMDAMHNKILHMDHM